ncbi:autotransporter adhesin [Lysobacter sp. OAE881]|uniref:YadA-like family protein n=1 Tax=Lysobacter sp. OAE881 TaxID=2663813 RepID=UPI00178958F5
MNKIYRVVWNAETGQWVVASEMAKGRKKSSSARATLLVSAVVSGAMGVAAPAFAGSLDGGNVNGQPDAVAYGPGASTLGQGATAIGMNAYAEQTDATALGKQSSAIGINSTALGNQVTTRGNRSIAIEGNDAPFLAIDAASTNAIAIGYQGLISSSVNAIALGSDASVKSGADSIAIGKKAAVTAANAVSLGGSSSATVASGVALGDSAVADRASGTGGSTKGAVSVGSGGTGIATDTRQIISVARGTQDTDAVNVSQLKGVTTALGGGAAVNADGTIKAPTYTVNGNTYNTVGDAIGNISNGGGIKYFHVNSTLSDSSAGGTDSTAIGPEATVDAAATGGVALGRSSSVTADAVGGAAIGSGATARADGAIAFGRDAAASVSSGVALGNGSKANRASGIGGSTKGAVSVGSGGADAATDTRQIISVARGTQDTDAVNVSQLKGVTTALGGGAAVNADGSVKQPSYTINGTTYDNVGSALTAAAASGGGETKYFHVNSTLNDSSAGGTDSTAIGPEANVNAAAGGGIAIGRSASITANATYGGVAIASGAKSDANDALAFGRDSTANVADSVALGHGAIADRASGTGGSTKGAVSVGSGGAGVATDTRQVISVARGTQNTDAVNLSQLKGVTTALGGGTAVNADGTIKAPTYTIQGTTANDVGTALSKLDTATTKNAGDITNLNTTVNNITNGGGIKYFHANSTLADSAATGANSIAVGPAATAKSSNGVAIGNAANANDGSTISIGGSSEAKGSWSVALGTSAKTTLDNSVALGSNSSVTVAGGVALGDSTVADRASGIGGSTKAAVSVGSGGAGVATTTRQIISVARGTQDTDAVNLSQLKSVVTDLGGGAAVNADGTIKAPTYDVNGTNYTNAGGAIDALDTRIDGVAANPLKFTGNDATAGVVSRKLGDTLAIKGLATTAGTFSGNNIKTVTDPTNGGISIQMADAPKFGNITVNDSGKISGVAAGTAATDVVNKGQLDAAVIQAGAGWKIKANAGTEGTIKGGDTLAVVDGTNTKVAFDSTKNELKVSVADAPTFSGMVTANGGLTVGAGKTIDMGGNKITKVAAGTADTDAVNVSQLKGITTAMGGGAAVASDGTITKPSYDVNGTKYDNVGGAVDALDTRIDGVNSTVTNITNGGGIKYFHANSTLADSAATGANSIAVGPAATAKSSNGVAIGNAANANDGSTISIGGSSEAKGSWSVTLGTSAKTALDNSVALGSNSSVTVAGGVALGDSTVADRASGIGGSTKAAVSVGSGGAGVATTTRQIISVARGTQDTDAVNLSQLKSVVTDLGGGAAVNADGTVKAPSYDVGSTTGITTVGGAINALDDRIDGVAANPLKFSGNSGTDVSRKLGDTLAIKGLATTAGTFSGNNIKTVTDPTNGGISIQMADAPKFGNVTINDSGKISGVAAGTAATDVVNKGQLDAAVIQAGAGWKLKANAGTEGTIKGGDTLAVVDGTNTKVAFDSTKNELKVSVADAPTFSGMVTANGGLTVGAGKTVDMGANKVTNLAAGTANTDAVNFGQLKASEQSVANALGGGSAVNTDGTITKPAYSVDGKTVNGVDGAITALDSGVKAAKDGINGLDGKIADLGDKGLTFSDTAGTKVQRKLGETLKISGVGTTAGTFSGNNIKTVADATTGEIKIQMADAPKFGNITVNDSGKISGLTDGTAATDAVTKGQMDTAVAGAGKWKLTANGATAKTITSSDTVNLVDGKNTKASFDSTTNQLKVDVVDAPTFSGMVTANGGLTVGAGKTVDMGGNKITNVAAGTANTDAVNLGQLKASEQSVANALGGGSAVNTDGTITKPAYSVDGKTVNGVDGAITALDSGVKAAKDGINGLDGKITDLGDKGLTFSDTAGTKVQRKLGETLKISGVGTTAGTFSGNNIKTVADATTGEIKIQMADSPQFGNIVINKGGNGAIDMGGGKITNLTDGTAATDAVTKKQLDDAVISAGAGWKIKANTGTAGTIKGGDTLAVVDGANTKVAFDSTKNELKVSVVDSPKFGDITINDNGKITGLENGTAAGDAATAGQLKELADVIGGGTKVDPTTGEIIKPSFDMADGTKADTVAGAIDNLDQRAKDAKDGIDGINGKIETITGDMADVVKYDSADHKKVTFGTAGTPVVLDNVASGKIAKDSKEAINGGQMFDVTKSVADAIGGGATVDPATGKVTEPTFTITDKDGKEHDSHTVADGFSTLDGRMDGIDGRVTIVEGNVTNIMNGAGIKYFHTNSTLADSQAKGVDSVAIGGNAIANAKNSVALGSNSTTDRENTVSVGKAGAERQVVNVKAGVQQTDAVNVSQLKGIADVIGGGTAIDPTTGAITPPKFDVTDKEGNVVPATSVVDAITKVDGHVVNVDKRVTNIEGDVTNIIDGKAGLVQQDETSREITVGKDTDGTVVNFTNKDGEARVLDGVANGEIKEGGMQAINGGQAYDIANSVTEALGGGSVVNPDGTISKPQYDVTNADGTTEKVDGVEGAITNLDQRTYDNTTNITNLTQQINEGSVGLVQYDDATGTVTVAAGKGGTMVDFANVDGEARQLKNVAAGAEDTDAVNVKQLKDILGGTDTQDENGNYVGPTYNVTNVDGTTHNSTTVGDALTTIDSRVTNVYNQLNEGTVGLVQQAAAGEKLTVGKDTDGTEVNFTGTAGDRKLTGVENGEVSDKSHDAVNGSQLYTVAQSVADAMGGGSTVNEDGSVTTPVYNVTNVDGTTTTVNGVEGAVNNLDQRTYSNTTQIQNITNQINGSGIGMVQQAAPGADLTVGKGTDGKAVNFTGTDGDRVLTGVAAGSADNDAVNIKQLKDAGVINKDGSANAVVTYDNAEKTSITMGGEGASTPVAIHNVADGVADHDAVNISQLNQRLQSNNTEVLNQANSYTDQRINDVWQDLGDEINQVNRQANRGIAAASALVNVTPYLPGKTAVNAGVASYRGEAALGVGVSRWSDNGRVNFNAGVSAAKGDEPVFRVGVGYVF